MPPAPKAYLGLRLAHPLAAGQIHQRQRAAGHAVHAVGVGAVRGARGGHVRLQHRVRARALPVLGGGGGGALQDGGGDGAEDVLPPRRRQLRRSGHVHAVPRVLTHVQGRPRLALRRRRQQVLDALHVQLDEGDGHRVLWQGRVTARGVDTAAVDLLARTDTPSSALLASSRSNSSRRARGTMPTCRHTRSSYMLLGGWPGLRSARVPCHRRRAISRRAAYTHSELAQSCQIIAGPNVVWVFPEPEMP